MKKVLIVIALGLTVFFLFEKTPGLFPFFAKPENSSDQQIENAYENRQSDIQVGGTGIVVKILRDDLEGSRHQRFILKLSAGQTILISHNIDIAPRIDALRKGDPVEFYGEYEWNTKGGVVHWTHHDPNGRHAHGWLKHNGVTYR